MCVGCGACVERCKAKNLVESKDILPTLAMIHRGDAPVYAIVAPAVISQFTEEVTPGKLRTALKALGFTGMVEVALFADILTLKEALEFDANILTDRDYQLTSCCCPMWIAMLRRVYKGIDAACAGCRISHDRLRTGHQTPGAGGQSGLYRSLPGQKGGSARTRHRGCSGLRAHLPGGARHLRFADIHPEKMAEDNREHSSMGGRIYARAGGVSQAVQDCVQRLNPNRKIKVHAVQASGVPACKQLLNDLKKASWTPTFGRYGLRRRLCRWPPRSDRQGVCT